MRSILFAFPFAALAAPAFAQSVLDVVDVRLLPGWRTADGAHMSGLEVDLAPGWKTYWRSPGDAGIPPRFSWSGSDNVAGVSVQWPTPKVFDQAGMRSVGYSGTVIFPLVVRPGNASKDATLAGTIELGVCEEICIPVQLDVATVLEVGATRESAALKAAFAERPMTAAEAGVVDVSCQFAPIADGMQVQATVTMPAFGTNEVAVLELADPSIWIAEPDVQRSGNQMVLTTDAVPVSGAPFALARSDVRVTIIADGQAVDIQGCG